MSYLDGCRLVFEEVMCNFLRCGARFSTRLSLIDSHVFENAVSKVQSEPGYSPTGSKRKAVTHLQQDGPPDASNRDKIDYLPFTELLPKRCTVCGTLKTFRHTDLRITSASRSLRMRLSSLTGHSITCYRKIRHPSDIESQIFWAWTKAIGTLGIEIYSTVELPCFCLTIN